MTGRQTRRQGRGASVGEADTGLVDTRSLPQGMNAELGGEGPIGQPGAPEPEKAGSCPTSFSLASKAKCVEFGGCL